jgi:hypothetical protein
VVLRNRTAALALVAALCAIVAVFTAATTAGASSSSATRQIPSGGTASIGGGSFTSALGGVQDPEFVTEAEGDDQGGGGSGDNGPGVDRSNSGATKGNGRSVNAHQQAKSNPELGTHFEGLNFFNQRFANGGNQFSVEPPDQGMCAGNGFVLESVNDVIRVYHSDGTPATGVVDLNTFYGYSAAINRTTGARGPEVTDPSCLYDPTTQRWFNVVLTLDVVPTGTSAGGFLGTNHIDIAVSNSSDPTGSWTVYRMPVQDDGTSGTPNHGCGFDGTPPAYRTNPNACLGDYPHIGVDANGFYVTTNEYEFFGDAFVGAQLYAFSKSQLASGASSVGVTQIDTSTAAPGNKPGFTIWPTQASAGQYSTDNGGTEFALSSTAADEAQCDSLTVCHGTGASTNILLWKLTGTSTLNSASPALSLSASSIGVDQYAIPPKSNQPATGDWPQGQCLNIPSCATAVLLGQPDPFTEVISHLDSNDTRMQQTWLANGKVWGALDTDVIVNGQHQAGVEYFVVNPSSGKLALQGTLGLAGNNLTYPAVAALPNGRGVMAYTVVGNDHYPSAGYSSLDAISGAGDPHIAAEGAGLDDGFTSYKAQVGDPPRTRWGDYGAAAVDGNTIWVASEYIAHNCTLSQWLTAPIGRCGNTRGALGNWSTHISQLTP